MSELLQRYLPGRGLPRRRSRSRRAPSSQGTVARVVVPIREGPRFSIGAVTVKGNAAVATDTILTDLPAVAGEPFLPMAAENALQRIRSIYWQRGYNEVHPEYSLALNRHTGQVDVQFAVEEGQQSVIAEIDVQGNDKTSDRLVREQLELTRERAARPRRAQPLAQEPVRHARVSRSSTSPARISKATCRPARRPLAENQKPVRVNVDVREVQPIQINYGASYDTERGVGGLFDISSHNSLGKARVIGLRTRYDAQLHDVRGTLTQPSLRYWPLETTANRLLPRGAQSERPKSPTAFDVDRKGISIIQERELADRYVWSYGYRYERARTFNTVVPGFDETLTVSPLTTTLTREGRDEVLDASTGRFCRTPSRSRPSWLGSTLPFVRYFGQYFYYLPLQGAAAQAVHQRDPPAATRLRDRCSSRAGLGLGRRHSAQRALLRGRQHDAPRLRPERRRAGGSRWRSRAAVRRCSSSTTSCACRSSAGWTACCSRDIGNVYPRVADFSLSDLRESAGVGLRVRTPWFLLRGDYGVVLDRRPGRTTQPLLLQHRTGVLSTDCANEERRTKN